MKKVNRILWGVVLVAAGVILALNALDVTNIDLLFDGWWSLFIIVPCAIGLFTEQDKTGNLIGLLIGVFLLLAAQDIVGYDLLLKLALPIIIVLIGLKMICGGFFGKKSVAAAKRLQENGANVKNGTAVFSGSDLHFAGETFEGAELTAVFGGVNCDLREAIITEDCAVNATAVFGGIDITVPAGVNVKIYSTSVFGGVSDKRKQPPIENAPTLYVNATCMFGGVDVK